MYASFPERGLCRPFLNRARELGFTAIELRENVPHFGAAVRELTGRLTGRRPRS